MKAEVFITTRFAALHRWPNAPEEVAFLRDFHRHEFHVKLCVPVSHNDRDVEFIMLKEGVDSYIRRTYEGCKFPFSCEHIASDLLTVFGASRVEVSEDGENGAVVTA